MLILEYFCHMLIILAVIRAFYLLILMILSSKIYIKINKNVFQINHVIDVNFMILSFPIS